VRVFRRLVVLIAITLAATTVAAPSAPAGEVPTRAVDTTGDFAGTVQLPNGRSVHVTCRGRGKPTVMLEGGLHSTADVWILPNDPAQTQPTVLPALAETTRVCAYDRPGTAISSDMLSRSDPVRMPRSTGAMVDDLRALQRAARITGPYVFVGHSMGGLIARQYTSLHPDDVVGLVLVEAIPESMPTDLSVSDWNTYDKLLLSVPSGQEDYPDVETVDFLRSFAQMRRAGVRPPRTIPMVVISRGQSFGIPGEVGQRLDAAWFEGQDRLAGLQPGTPHLVSTDSGHEVEFEDPKIVIDAAQRVIGAVRDGRTTLGTG
jgi:pimeloyl-ACP methyl ester carboxylesterase